MNNRSARLEGEFKRGLSEIFLTDINDPRMSSMVGVTRVDVTPDLKFAKVFLSIYDTPQRISDTLAALQSAESFIRSRLNSKIRIRRIPSLSFVHDTSIEYSVKMSKLIDDVMDKQRDSDDVEMEAEIDVEAHSNITED